MWQGHQKWYALQFSLLAAITSGSALFATLLPVTVMGHVIRINLALSSLFSFEHHFTLFCSTIIQLSIYIYTK